MFLTLLQSKFPTGGILWEPRTPTRKEREAEVKRQRIEYGIFETVDELQSVEPKIVFKKVADSSLQAEKRRNKEIKHLLELSMEDDAILFMLFEL